MRLVNSIFAGTTANAYGTADTVQQFPLGTRMFGVQSDPSTVASVLNGGGGEFIYMQSVAAVAVGTPVSMLTKDWAMAPLANTANLGIPVGVAACRFTATGQFGWVQVAGQCPVVTNGTFTGAGAPVFIQAAGVLSTTVAAGKQIMGASMLIASAATFTKTVKTKVNSAVVQLMSGSDTAGVFCGLAASGTGIAASVVNDIDPGGNFLTLSANATASGTVTMTLTYTNLGAAMISHPCAQGQIT